MRTDAMRAAGWSVVLVACITFVSEVRRIAVPPPVPPAAEDSAPARSPLPPPPLPLADKAPVSERYVGNTNTHRFHRSSCRYASCKNCTARFQTRDAAIAAGFRPGGCCDP